MNYLQKLCILLAIVGLISCDNSGTQSTTSSQQTPSTNTPDSASAIKQLDARVKSNPNDFDAWKKLGKLYFGSSQFEKAIAAIEGALAVNPQCADCLNDKGLAQYYMGDPQSAIKSFDQAVTVDPGFARAWLSKGWVLTVVGQHQEAIVALNKVKELDATGTLSWEADKFLKMIAEGEPR